MDRTDLQRLSKDELIELVIQLQRPDKNVSDFVEASVHRQERETRELPSWRGEARA